jgi:hypothetical protein
MKNSKKINRNAWSAQELETLMDCVSHAKTVGKGIKSAAIALGRTASACTFKYYSCGGKSVAIKAVKVEDTATITFKIKSWAIDNGQLKVEIYKQA